MLGAAGFRLPRLRGTDVGRSRCRRICHRLPIRRAEGGHLGAEHLRKGDGQGRGPWRGPWRDRGQAEARPGESGGRGAGAYRELRLALRLLDARIVLRRARALRLRGLLLLRLRVALLEPGQLRLYRCLFFALFLSQICKFVAVFTNLASFCSPSLIS